MTIMKLRSDGFPATTLVTALAIAWAVGIGVAAGLSPAGPTSTPTVAVSAPAPAITPAPAAPADGQATGFVGDETCTTCHEPEGKALKGTLHGKAQNVRT